MSALAAVVFREPVFHIAGTADVEPVRAIPAAQNIDEAHPGSVSEVKWKYLRTTDAGDDPTTSRSSGGAHISGVVSDATPQWRFDGEGLKKLPEVKSDEEFLKLAHTRPKAEPCPKVTVYLRGLTTQQEKIVREAVTNDQGQYACDGLPHYEVWAKLPSPA